MESPYFQGEVYDVQFFPFVLREWERRRVLRYWPIIHLDQSSLIINEDGTITEWRNRANEPDNPLAKALMPRWFRAWLWLRTMYSRLT